MPHCQTTSPFIKKVRTAPFETNLLSGKMASLNFAETASGTSTRMSTNNNKHFSTLANTEEKGGETMITVRNIHGTSDSHGTWLAKWKEKNGYNPSDNIHCCIHGCPHRATDGAHVIKSHTGMRQFIVPMCRSHNLTYNQDLLAYDWAKPMPVVS